MHAIEQLDRFNGIEPAEATLLREAADARLFGDEDSDRWLVDAEAAFERISRRGDVAPDEVAILRAWLWEIAAVPERQRAAG